MEILDKYFKYWTAYVGIIYTIGFLILSTRLASMQIFIKDFLTLDYLKAGLLFFVIHLPIYFIANESIAVEGAIKKFLIHILSITACGFALYLISPWLFEDIPDLKSGKGIVTFIMYPFYVYFILQYFQRIDIRKIKEKGFDLAIIIVAVVLSLNFFSMFIFPQIKFKFGGGAPYEKIIYVKTTSNKIKEIEATIYYESSDWIYAIDNRKVLSIPKNRVVKEESPLQNEFLLNFLE